MVCYCWCVYEQFGSVCVGGQCGCVVVDCVVGREYLMFCLLLDEQFGIECGWCYYVDCECFVWGVVLVFVGVVGYCVV